MPDAFDLLGSFVRLDFSDPDVNPHFRQRHEESFGLVTGIGADDTVQVVWANAPTLSLHWCPEHLRPVEDGYYLPLDCPNCDRRRVEANGVCEKCGWSVVKDQYE